MMSSTLSAAVSLVFTKGCSRRLARALALVLLLSALPLSPGSLAAQDPASADPAAQDPEPQPPIEAVTTERSQLDEATRNQLQAVFDRVASLSQVDVRVDAGVVTLEGTVVSGEVRSRAAELAAGMEGVLFVDNRIRESSSLEEQLEPTWERLRELGYGAVVKLPLLVVAALIVGFAGLLGILVSRWKGPSFLRTRNPFLQSLIQRLIQIALLFIGLIVALDLLDATALVGAVIGTAGLAGLALGFAFKDIGENYLAGTILAFRQPFSKNDHIVVQNFEGKVVRLTARETILMTLDGNHVSVPNAMVFRNPMTNFTRNPLRRFQFEMGLGSNDDLAQARRIAVSALSSMEGVLDEPPPQALVVDLGDSSVTMRFSGWMDQRNAAFGRVRSEAIRLVKARLEDAGLTLPSPEYLVQLGGEGATPSGEPASAPSPDRPKKPTPTATVDVTPDDVSVDRSIDEQIETDRHTSEEPDLLDPKKPA